LGKLYEELYFQYCQRLAVSAAESLDSLRMFPAADVLVDRLLRTIPMPFLVVLSQSLFVGVIACILALTIEPLGRNAIAGAAWELVYGGVIAAAVGYLIQVVAQAHVTAPTAAVLLSAEAPFAALFGVLVKLLRIVQGNGGIR